jgi:serine/threonine-protein kinase RsbW
VTGRAIRFVIESRLENVALAGRAAAALSVYSGLSEVEAAQIELCVVEAANNCIRHAYSLEPGHEVDVSWSFRDGRLEIGIADEGTPIPGGLQPKTFDFDPDDIAGLPEGGMGLYIINSVMDELEYRTAGGRNVLIMKKTFAADPAAALTADRRDR